MTFSRNVDGVPDSGGALTYDLPKFKGAFDQLLPLYCTYCVLTHCDAG